MKIVIPFLASLVPLLLLFSNNVHSESYPVSKCFCQSRSRFLNLTLVIKKTTSKLVTHCTIYKLVNYGGNHTNNANLIEFPIDKDKNFTYSEQLSNIKGTRVNLKLTNNSIYFSDVNLFTYDEKTQRACYSDDNEVENRTCVIIVDLSIILQKLIKSVPPVGRQGESKTEASTYDSRSVYNILYIAAGIACTLLVIIIIAKKYRIKKSSSQRQLELETYITTERVLYADLDNLPENSNRTIISNASPYATIIGSLHPKEHKK